MRTAHHFKPVYHRMGINLNELGCFMLDTTSPMESIDGEEYYSPDPNQWWIKGILDEWHVTVRYGFLPDVKDIDVDEVLYEQKMPRTLEVIKYEVFPSYNGEYDCLVARVEDTLLSDMNQQLGVLPNVATFPEYKPHITMGYFKTGRWSQPKLNETVAVLGPNYGHVLTSG